MKVAVLSESPADEAALHILVSAILGRTVEEALLDEAFRVRTGGGWGEVLRLLPAVIPHLNFYTEVDVLVVVLDSDNSPVHELTHEQPGNADEKCRLCQLQQRVLRIGNGLQPRVGGETLKTALGLAVPCIEAWYLCGESPHVGEVQWKQSLKKKQYHSPSNELKRQVYGTDRPPKELMRHRAIEKANRLRDRLSELETWFPGGFGTFARDVRNW